MKETDRHAHPDNEAAKPVIDQPKVICDLTQSYSSTAGGGVGIFMREKCRFVLDQTPHILVQIVPGEADKVSSHGRHILVEVGSAAVRGSQHYRFIKRTSAVKAVLDQYRPDVIECLCPWVLPWTAIGYRRQNPETALVAGYHTDFPNAQVGRVARGLFGERIASGFRALSYSYAEVTYRQFDRLYTLNQTARIELSARRLDRIDVLPLGVDLAVFSPERRDSGFRHALGCDDVRPLLVYAGRLDAEKKVDQLLAMMRHLPAGFPAQLVLLGDGRLRERLVEEAAGLPVSFLGFEPDRWNVARALASCDLYVSAMADETFGLSVAEAQACGLPVVGVAAGAMSERVNPGLGLLGPVDNPAAMAGNVVSCFHNRSVIATAARRHAEQHYGWHNTFRTLFDDIYPQAIQAARDRAGLRVDRPARNQARV